MLSGLQRNLRTTAPARCWHGRPGDQDLAGYGYRTTRMLHFLPPAP